MVIDQILNAVVPGRAARQARQRDDTKLDGELNDSFPTSDPLSVVQPGSGITGAEVKPSELSPSQKAKAGTTKAN
ncbi:hypothetical protein GGR25_004053 [Kaistia hirudinis]|uniref:Uncharacterized protein n=1 Tax=Kaistia hirudinis TaxID=1293440 RepID=A0A840ARV8_9HYPH|nr:hypothetical protein [Kaistia hirudinis]MBB3932989.1 hypothetical protein [Kaistia hirudinis]